jgi:hypothetical protein
VSFTDLAVSGYWTALAVAGLFVFVLGVGLTRWLL